LIFGNNLFSNVSNYILATNSTSHYVYLGTNDIGKSVYLSPPPGRETITVYQNIGDDTNVVWSNAKNVAIYVDGTFANGIDVLHSPTGQFIEFAAYPPDLTSGVKIAATYQYSAAESQKNNTSFTKYDRYFTKKITVNDPNSSSNLNLIMNAYDTQLAFALNKVTLTVDDYAFYNANGVEVTNERFITGARIHLYNSYLNIDDYFWIYRVITKIEGGTLRSYDLELRNWNTT
jgi:hypothetical protein